MNSWQHPPTLCGPHVQLQPLQRGHAEALRAAAADGELWRHWYTSVPAPEQMEDYIDKALRMQQQGRALAFAVCDPGGVPVGSTRFYDLAPDVPRLQIGYTWYARRVQRTGLNTEAKQLLLGHAFETLGCICVGFQTSWFNHASRQAIERIGARCEGVLRHHLRHADGSIRDTVCYSIIDSEWPAVKRHLQARLEAHA